MAYYFRIFLFSLVCFFSGHLFANSPQIINLTQLKEEVPFSISSKGVYFEDETSVLSIRDVAHGSDKFQSTDKEIPNFGLSSSSIWVNFLIRNDIEREDKFVIEIQIPWVESIEFYYLGEDGKWNKTVSGRKLKYTDRKYENQYFLFDLAPIKGVTSYYFKINSSYAINLPFYISTVKSAQREHTSRQFIYGIVFGIILLVALYNLMMYINLRERISLIYVLSALIFGVYNFTFLGLDVIYIYPNSTAIQNVLPAFLAGISLVLGALFSRAFLKTYKYIYWLDRVLLVGVILGLFLSVIAFFHISVPFKKVLTFAAASIFFPIVLASYIRFRQGFKPAKTFLIGWSVLAISILIYTLHSVDAISSNFVTINAIPLGAVGEMVFLTISMTYSFKLLQENHDKIQEEKLSHLEELELLNDKINRELESKVGLRTQEIIAQKEEIIEKSKLITDSINYAKKIQDAILPIAKGSIDTMEDHFVYYRPKSIVSGDFYWYNIVGNKLIIAAVDCTGHGVPGAFMSLIGHTALNNIVLEQQITEPHIILDKLHHRIKTVLHQEGDSLSKDGMDVALCVINLENNNMTYAGAMRPLYIVRNDEIVIFKGSKTAVGGNQQYLETGFSLVSTQLEEGDMIYMFSDGYPDQFGGKLNKKFLIGRFKNLLLDIYKLPCEEQRLELDKRLEEWKGDSFQVDDVMVIGVRVPKPNTQSFIL